MYSTQNSEKLTCVADLMGNANRIQRDERSLLTEEIREGYWIWWAFKEGGGDCQWSLYMVGTKHRGLEILTSGGLVGKDQMDLYRARL